MPGTMKVTNAKDGSIKTIEAENAFVFFERQSPRKLYLNVGGQIYHLFSDCPIALQKQP